MINKHVELGKSLLYLDRPNGDLTLILLIKGENNDKNNNSDLPQIHRHFVGSHRMFDEMDRMFENSKAQVVSQHCTNQRQ